MQKNFQLRFTTTITTCLKNEGILGFYKGMAFPFYTITFVNAVVFWANETSKKILNISDESKMSVYESLLCGGIAGFINCSVITPVELVKIRLQLQFENKAHSYYKGVFDVLIKQFKEMGIKGLYVGNSAMILREVPATAAQFGGYHLARLLFCQMRGVHIDDLKNIDILIAGSVAGLACWQFSYPQVF